MNKILALLVTFVFLQTQVWALSGGPVLGAQANSDLTGVYSGVMVNKSQLGAPPTPIVGGTPTSAAIGTFSITVPIAGASTGTTVFFQNNVVYTGTITAAADAVKRTIVGIITATSTATFILTPTAVGAANTVTAATTTPVLGQGFLQARISRNTVVAGITGNQGANGISRAAGSTLGGVDAAGNPRSLGNQGDRISGTATIDIVFNDRRIGKVGLDTTVAAETKYSLSGVRETNVIAAAAP